MKVEDINKLIEKLYIAEPIRYGEEFMQLDSIEFSIAKQMTESELIYCETLTKNNFDKKRTQDELGYYKNLTTNERCSRYIDYKIKKFMQSNKIDIVNNYKFLRDIMYSNVLDYIEIVEEEDKRGNVYQKILAKDLKRMPREMQLLIKEIEQDKAGNVIIKLYDKFEALRMSEKYLGLEKGVVNVNNITIDNSTNNTNNYSDMSKEELIQLALDEGIIQDLKEVDLYDDYESGEE